jgi:hypothetical protein
MNTVRSSEIEHDSVSDMLPLRFVPSDTDGESSSLLVPDHITSRSAASTPIEKSEQQQKNDDAKHSTECAHMKHPRGTIQCPAQNRMVKALEKAKRRQMRTVSRRVNTRLVRHFGHARAIDLVDGTS